MTAAIESDICDLAALPPSTTPQNDPAKSRPSATFVRWCKFNFVGAIGIVVQFAALFLLKGMLHLNYLLATAIAVEAAVLHNFVWHERFTWADRISCGSAERGLGARSNAHANASSWQRLLRFHLANGSLSILGNLALMKVMVGLGHMNYLAANVTAIAVCSIVNFGLSDAWVFEGEGFQS